VFGLILDSLGSTELIFILAVALIFFGPRKLPQLARSVGKSVAEFRKASEDFKRTWEREVAMESSRLETSENTILDTTSNETNNASLSTGTSTEWVEPVAPVDVVARESQPAPIDPVIEPESTGTPSSTEPSKKHDWL
jgi:Tat protein translocase TatB subunit